MSVYKRGSHWHYRFRVRRVRYRGALPEASTKWEAEQAESKIKQEIFEGRFGLVDLGSERLADFISKTFLPWSKANKRSWRHDVFRARTICDYFGTKTFREMSPLLIEKFKRDRRESITRREKVRSPASVNHELTLLSKIFNLAIDYRLRIRIHAPKSRSTNSTTSVIAICYRKKNHGSWRRSVGHVLI